MDSHSGHHAYLCDGTLHKGKGGSWVGHFLPGIVLFTWGLHWFVSICHGHLTAKYYSKAPKHSDDRADSAPAATHPIIFLPQYLNLEAWLKVIFPAIAICLEFALSGTRNLRCPPGTAKAGEIDIQHLNSWSHATNYPIIMLSGITDIIHSYYHPLPAGVPHGVLSVAFGVNAFLMLMHSKAEPLDALVHKLLGYCMAGVCGTVAAAGVWPDSFTIGAAKSLALMMQGLWFFAVTHIEFSNDVMWSASYNGDMTRVTFTPILFAWTFTGLVVFMLLVYVLMQVLHKRSNRRMAVNHLVTASYSKRDEQQYKTGDTTTLPKYLQLSDQKQALRDTQLMVTDTEQGLVSTTQGLKLGTQQQQQISLH